VFTLGKRLPCRTASSSAARIPLPSKRSIPSSNAPTPGKISLAQAASSSAVRTIRLCAPAFLSMLQMEPTLPMP
jgi:hypothetical protein